MATTTGENLVVLLDSWASSIKQPTNLVFAQTLYHDLQILSEIINYAITSSTGLRRWQKNLVADLNALLNASGYEGGFIKSHYPNLHAQLVSASTPDSGGNYDLNRLDQSIQDATRVIQSPTYLTHIHTKLTATVVSAVPDAKDKIETLTRMLLVRLIEVAAPRTLDEHAAAAVSKSFLSLHTSELEAALKVPNVRQSLIDFIEALSSSLGLFVQTIASVAQGSEQERATNLASYLLTSDREFSARVNLFFLQEMFDGIAFPPNIVNDLFDASTRRKEKQSEFVVNSLHTDFWNGVGDKWFERFSGQAIYFFTRLYAKDSDPQWKSRGSEEDWIKVYKQQASQVHDYWDAYCDQAVDSLLSLGLFEDWESPVPDWIRKKIPVFRMTPGGRVRDLHGWDTTLQHNARQKLKDVINGILAFSLGIALGANSSVNFDSSQRIQMKRRLLRVVLEEILQHLVLSIERGEVDPANPRSGDVEKVLNRLQAQRRISEVLVDWLSSFSLLFLSSSQLFGSDSPATFVEGNIITFIETLNENLIDHIIKSFKKTDVNFLLNQIQGSEIDRVLADLILLFAQPASEYRVIGVVDGLDLKGENLEIGQVRLYDARVWDYGEANLLDSLDLPAYRGNVERYAPTAQTGLIQLLSSSYEYKGRYGTVSNQLVRHSARATTAVQAYDYKMAQELATIQANQTLDVLSWCYTARKKDDESSKLELLPYYVVINDRERRFHQVTARDLPMLTRLDAKDKNLANFAEFYDPLLSQPEISRTPVERAVVRSLHWLAKGYWETHQADQFLNYWIALEQLFVQAGKGKLEGVQRRLPGLVSTWDCTELGQQLLISCRELAEEVQTHRDIQTQLDANPNFSNWQTNKLVLLQNLTQLEQIDTLKKLTHLPKLKSMFDPNAITAAKYELQEKTRYQIALFYRRRNLIVHEGYSHSPDMAYYTEALWEFARSACARVAGRICANVGQFQTIDEVIVTYDTPW